LLAFPILCQTISNDGGALKTTHTKKARDQGKWERKTAAIFHHFARVNFPIGWTREMRAKWVKGRGRW